MNGLPDVRLGRRAPGPGSAGEPRRPDEVHQPASHWRPAEAIGMGLARRLPNNEVPKKWRAVKKAVVAQMPDSYGQEGQLQPIGVRPDPTREKEGSYLLRLGQTPALGGEEARLADDRRKGHGPGRLLGRLDDDRREPGGSALPVGRRAGHRPEDVERSLRREAPRGEEAARLAGSGTSGPRTSRRRPASPTTPRPRRASRRFVAAGSKLSEKYARRPGRRRRR